jgi:hypothetical protein
MQFSQQGRPVRARLVVLLAGAVAAGTLAGCGGGGGGGGDAPLIRATIKLQSITQQGECEATNVKVTPVQLLPNPPSMSNSREFVTEIKLTKGADGVACTGENNTIPMAPGKWKFTANLPSDPAACERDIASGGNLTINFKDGDSSCS